MNLPPIVRCDKLFGPDTMADLIDYSLKYLESLRTQLRYIRTARVTDMRRILEGKPREEIKSFPWQNAANLVVQLVASFTDQLAARMVMGIYNVQPLFPIRISGTIDPKLRPERKRELLEDFLCHSATDPSTLNLIEIEYSWFRNAIGYGCQALKVNLVDDSMVMVSKDGKPKIVGGYQGPELIPIDYEDFLMPPEAMPIERMPFKAQALHLSRFQIEERIASGAWDKTAAEIILSAGSEMQDDQPRKELQSDQKVAPSGTKEAQIFTVYECHVKFPKGDKTFECILTLHPETKSCPKAIFRFYPPEIQPFLLLRFGGGSSPGSRSYGLGLIESLQDYQEEVSQIHNQRRDAATAANTNVLRVTPGSQLDTMTTLYPMGIIPAPPGSLEWLQLGRNPIETIQDENLVRQEAAERAGVHPSFSGSGSGGPNKRGVYSAMGTMSVMQEGNSRTDMNLALFRNAHVLLGKTLLNIYAEYGVSQKVLKSYADDRPLLEEALEAYSAGTMQAMVHAGTASVNREVEKQNLMLMMQNLRQHYQQAVSMLQMIENPMTPPDMKMYLAKALHSMDTLMEWAVRNFGIRAGGQEFVPDTETLIQKVKQGNQGQQQPQIPAQARQVVPSQPNPTPQQQQ